MHQLILLRHAKAAPANAAPSDHDRPLTDAGRQAAATIAAAMRKAGLAPDVVLVSTALRTQQTFAELETAGVWDEWPNIDSLPVLYMAAPNRIRDLLRELPETVRSALVIGHNPGLHDLALAISGPASSQPDLVRLNDGFPTAAMAEFLVTTPWRRLGAHGATLQRFIKPADII
ncbi:histidine phosphatase family protein [Acidocella sp.]|uniref:SixA phosphatase family protein n=1 Tax=Acidocella sp. TaxID=50710 RepID=UPI00262E08BC|nr:histidine phosphatase family protein [Acidocella sp.]MDD2795260.1 histidine phosphatase family protein [Acidocella sp.]